MVAPPPLPKEKKEKKKECVSWYTRKSLNPFFSWKEIGLWTNIERYYRTQSQNNVGYIRPIYCSCIYLSGIPHPRRPGSNGASRGGGIQSRSGCDRATGGRRGVRRQDTGGSSSCHRRTFPDNVTARPRHSLG